MSAQKALFENMPAAVRGCVFGVLASIVSASSLVPILIAGPLADAISGPTVIAIAAVGVVVVAARFNDVEQLLGRPHLDRMSTDQLH